MRGMEKLRAFMNKGAPSPEEKIDIVDNKLFEKMEKYFIEMMFETRKKITFGQKIDSGTMQFLKLTLDVLKARKLEYKERTKGYFTPDDYKKIIETINMEETTNGK